MSQPLLRGLILLGVLFGASKQTRLPRVLAGQSNSKAGAEVTIRVPFVGCRADGQARPLEAPTSAEVEVRLPLKTAERLTLYKAQGAPAVLGPRGWSCFGLYGSSGYGVFVTPTPLDPSKLFGQWGITSFGIQAYSITSETSGRITVAGIAARVFPKYRSAAERLIAEYGLSAAEYPSVPFPTDRLVYRSDRIVEYETQPRSSGLGTYFRMVPDNNPIQGTVIMLPDLFLQYLSVRLPENMKDLSPVIIRQFEAGK